MPYLEDQEQLEFFEDWENDKIEGWLRERNLRWGFPTVCGSCCGFYSQEFWVELSAKAVKAFNAFAVRENICAVADRSGIRIGIPEATV